MLKKRLLDKKLLCLGTAKLDNKNYGYSNSEQSFSANEVIRLALKYGFNSIDSSPRYNNSEHLIGNYIRNQKKNIFISSKIENLEPNNEKSIDKIFSSVKHSLKAMQVQKLDLCFLHQNDLNIISDKYIKKGLKLLKDYELVNEIGTSIYSLDELDYTLNSNFYEWVQIPLNITDTYFYNHILEKKIKIKIAARSVLMQGLLLQDYSIISKSINNSDKFINYITSLKRDLKINDQAFKLIAISYIGQLENLSMIILGSMNPDNLKFFIESLNKPIDKKILSTINENAHEFKEWSNPRNWLNVI